MNNYKLTKKQKVSILLAPSLLLSTVVAVADSPSITFEEVNPPTELENQISEPVGSSRERVNEGGNTRPPETGTIGGLDTPPNIVPNPVPQLVPNPVPTSESMYEVIDHGNGTVSIWGYLSNSPVVYVPKEINRKTVVGIEAGAFEGKSITTLVLPNSIIRIANNAFSNNNITDIELPDSITYIGNNAFATNQISSLRLPARLNSLGVGAFSDNSISTLNIPNTLTGISDRAFANNRLVAVNLPDSIQTVGADAFRNNQLSSLNIPLGLSQIGRGAFANNRISNIYIPETVMDASMDSFHNNPLNNVTIPKRLQNILSGVGSITALENIYLYETGKDPGRPAVNPQKEKEEQDKKDPNKVNLSNLTSQQILSLGLISGNLSMTKPNFVSNSFGSIRIIDKPITLSMAMVNDLIVSDLRGTMDGWHLTVSATPLTEVPVVGGKAPAGGWHKLPAGTIALSQPEVVYEVDERGNAIPTKENIINTSVFQGKHAIVDSGSVTVLTTAQNSGAGVWGARFPKDALLITISPKTARVDKVNYPNGPTPYTTTITWDLVSGPGLQSNEQNSSNQQGQGISTSHNPAPTNIHSR